MAKKHPLSGSKQTPEQVRKRVEAVARNRATWSEEKIASWKEKISKNNKAGTPEVRRKISESHKGQTAWNKGRKSPEWSGENHPMFGKKHKPESIEKMRRSKVGKKQTPETIAKRIAPLIGRSRSEEVKEKIRQSNLKTWSRPEIIAKVSGENNPGWKGLFSRKLCSFDKYRPLLKGIEEVRRDPDEPVVLQVRCTYCGRWFAPDILHTNGRVRYIEGRSTQEWRLYCSEQCKQFCPIYNKISKPRGYGLATSREVQAELRRLVFERDDWKCEICHSTESLHCHHITGILLNPIESADIDNCITLCESHHKWVHTNEGCRYHDLRCT